jgi:hypothetical protein
MRINPKYLKQYGSVVPARRFDNDPAGVINSALQDLGECLEEGVNFEMSCETITEDCILKGDTSLSISCVVLTPEVFRKMVEKIDYHDPYYMDLIFPDLSTIEP